MSTAPPPLAADLNDGLKRLKMAAMRRLAPELLVTAKTQRWNPEEFLRTLVEAEITALHVHLEYLQEKAALWDARDRGDIAAEAAAYRRVQNVIPRLKEVMQ